MNFRFLRGSYESEVLNLETDTLQAHKHNHHLYDPGHQHQYEDMWAWPHHAHNTVLKKAKSLKKNWTG